MASVEKRPNGYWRARWKNPQGREVTKSFKRKVEAQQHIREMTAAIVIGQYVDPSAGRVTFRDYAEQWRAGQVQHSPGSRAHVETQLRLHVYPFFGDRRINEILPSEVQAWVSLLANGDPTTKRKPMAASTVGVVHVRMFSVMKAAVRDKRILANPCEGTRLPKKVRTRVVPPTTEQVQLLTEAMPEEWRAVITVAAGTGLRQGELFGLTVDRVNMLRREATVDRQILTLANQPAHFGPPKTEASVRTIPLPQVVVDALAAHMAKYPPGEHGLIFTHEGGKPIHRQAGSRVFRPAAKAAGLPLGTGIHALRHYYASLLIRHGESVKTVQTRLGHASAVETLDTYAGMWPDGDDTTRAAIDSVLGPLTDNRRTLPA